MKNNEEINKPSQEALNFVSKNEDLNPNSYYSSDNRPNLSFQDEAFTNTFVNKKKILDKGVERDIDILDETPSAFKIFGFDNNGKLARKTENDGALKIAVESYDNEGKPLLELINGTEEDILKSHKTVVSAFGPKTSEEGFTSAFSKSLYNGFTSLQNTYYQSKDVLNNVLKDKGEYSKEAEKSSISNMVNDLPMSYKASEEWTDNPKSAIAGIGQGISSMFTVIAPSLAVNAGIGLVTGGLGLSASIPATAGIITGSLVSTALNTSEAWESSKKAGLSPSDAAKLSLSVGSIAGIIEGSIGPNLLTGGAKKVLIENMTKEILKETTGKKLSKELISSITPNIIKKYTPIATKLLENKLLNSSVVKTSLEEFKEESLQSLNQKAQENLYDFFVAADNSEIGKGKFGTKFFSEKTYTQALTDGLMGAMVGGISQGTGGALTTAKNKIFGNNNEDLNTQDYILNNKSEDLIKQTGVLLRSKQITQEQHDSYINKIKDMDDLYKSTSKSGIFKNIVEHDTNEINDLILKGKDTKEYKPIFSDALEKIEEQFNKEVELKNVNQAILDLNIEKNNSKTQSIKDSYDTKIKELELNKSNLQSEIQNSKSVIDSYKNFNPITKTTTPNQFTFDIVNSKLSNNIDNIDNDIDKLTKINLNDYSLEEQEKIVNKKTELVNKKIQNELNIKLKKEKEEKEIQNLLNQQLNEEEKKSKLEELKNKQKQEKEKFDNYNLDFLELENKINNLDNNDINYNENLSNLVNDYFEKNKHENIKFDNLHEKNKIDFYNKYKKLPVEKVDNVIGFFQIYQDDNLYMQLTNNTIVLANQEVLKDIKKGNKINLNNLPVAQNSEELLKKIENKSSDILLRKGYKAQNQTDSINLLSYYESNSNPFLFNSFGILSQKNINLNNFFENIFDNLKLEISEKYVNLNLGIMGILTNNLQNDKIINHDWKYYHESNFIDFTSNQLEILNKYEKDKIEHEPLYVSINNLNKDFELVSNDFNLTRFSNYSKIKNGIVDKLTISNLSEEEIQKIFNVDVNKAILIKQEAKNNEILLEKLNKDFESGITNDKNYIKNNYDLTFEISKRKKININSIIQDVYKDKNGFPKIFYNNKGLKKDKIFAVGEEIAQGKKINGLNVQLSNSNDEYDFMLVKQPLIKEGRFEKFVYKEVRLTFNEEKSKNINMEDFAKNFNTVYTFELPTRIDMQLTPKLKVESEINENFKIEDFEIDEPVQIIQNNLTKKSRSQLILEKQVEANNKNITLNENFDLSVNQINIVEQQLNNC